MILFFLSFLTGNNIKDSNRTFPQQKKAQQRDKVKQSRPFSHRKNVCCDDALTRTFQSQFWFLVSRSLLRLYGSETTSMNCVAQYVGSHGSCAQILNYTCLLKKKHVEYIRMI